MYQDCNVWTVVKVPVNGRFPASEVTRRDPQLFATSAILGDAEAHSPTFASYEYRQGFAFRYTTGRERGSISPLAMATSAPCGTARTVFTPPCSAHRLLSWVGVPAQAPPWGAPALRSAPSRYKVLQVRLQR
jgi:hypothetical protein